ncbi:hypothetical protein HDU79_007130 [Rhizoclosmatium sp. JEL0117]|nr:hypothetical protein HDU79_007130 [Rhizoclosmatium sp. JEL0117]
MTPFPILDQLSLLLGWTYFLAWSISFYPQIILNAHRRSVTGLSVDFVLLNVLGFLCYTIFNCVEYFRFENPDVQLNDVVFAVHALVLCCVAMAQVVVYSPDLKSIVAGTRVETRVAVVGIPVLIGVCSIVLPERKTLVVLGSVKLAISLYKYLPQLFLNWRRGSTVGWSITNILLDATGGILSVAQLFVDAARLNRDPFENPVKLAIMSGSPMRTTAKKLM